MAPSSRPSKKNKRKKSLSDHGGSPQKQSAQRPKKKAKKHHEPSGSEYSSDTSIDKMDTSEDEISIKKTKPMHAPAGRPSNQTKRMSKTGNSAHVLPSPAQSTLLEPVTPPQKSKKSKSLLNTYTPRTAQAVAFSVQPPIYEIDVSPDQKQQSRHRSGNSTLQTLNKIKHSSEDGWTLLGKCRTEQLCWQFDKWKNDYSPQTYDVCDQLVVIQFLGHPCDRPKDICARPFLIQWDRTLDRKIIKTLSKKSKPIY
ncbi:hypothetical protein CPB83DRAFT_513020 [Crepidotus variabilis]|uniref:Uncharacterized protein n=1 Tax=Crepidotus variabilis TaxID=179855 RepID=A0A9P6JMK0_9AGAR|nr:hypothetical protein CPB83DRAFT_513020 [Crepidotus variabilis]